MAEDRASGGDDASPSGAADVTIDATGLLCPLPIIELGRAARGRAPGTTITVVCTDVAARLDVPAWARMTGHEFVGETKTDGGAVALTVRLL
ncbi:sulfurtransferase TusA family protein [Demequina lignilytica]|uniref:Sulfurtransferase TusA family protein n=1 Tax=Demequina lignilytica TaxID=3051663 RepID=A0AAW7M6P5_9MICO|nr:MULTISPECIES: sulfurtransferase TusA family protein [unclassified Demequina]MDN4482169.1 sulfurtransferase TusA family protein [Demequina sp. SYSU T0a273]MDN4486828.1 sulfurtransferase TusA family protein [Demequina sp. SYSU T00039]MDN4489512.1 sulfurtransferase TusA family protein [Demequina sp. SYSU T00068]